MKVAVIGGGPSGLFCAWAAIQYGHDVTVFDQNPGAISIGKNHGVFALWSDCDLFLSNKVLVKADVIGAMGKDSKEIERAYATKVYGDPNQQVSVAKYIERKLECYNHSEAYERIIDILGGYNIKKFEVSNLSDILALLGVYDKVFVTIPATMLWPEERWPWGYSYVYNSSAPHPDAFMIYNVNEFIPWYRCSAIFGNFTMEYSALPTAESNKRYITVKKVIDAPKSPNELCGVDNIHFIGRYGKWDKSVLSEDCYRETLQILSHG